MEVEILVEVPVTATAMVVRSYNALHLRPRGMVKHQMPHDDNPGTSCGNTIITSSALSNASANPKHVVASRPQQTGTLTHA